MTVEPPKIATAPRVRSGCSTSKTDYPKDTKAWICVNSGEISFEIRPCPAAGHGVHQWAYGTWHRAREAGLSEEEADAVCDEHATRTLTRGDYPRDFPKAKRSGLWKPKPSYSPEKLKAFAAKAQGFTAEDMQRKSPISPDEVTPADFLRVISLPGEKRIVFSDYESQGQHLWICPPGHQPHDRNQLKRFVKSFAGAWFLANPADGRKRYNERLRKESARAVENLTSFPFLVVESDAAPHDLWIAALSVLPLPIVAVYESGKKSVHALVKIGAATEEEWKRAVEKRRGAFVMLGADDAAMRAVQLSRLPQCFRAETGKWQRLLYLNGAPDGTPIIEQPNRGNAAPISNKQDGEKAQ